VGAYDELQEPTLRAYDQMKGDYALDRPTPPPTAIGKLMQAILNPIQATSTPGVSLGAITMQPHAEGGGNWYQFASDMKPGYRWLSRLDPDEAYVTGLMRAGHPREGGPQGGPQRAASLREMAPEARDFVSFLRYLGIPQARYITDQAGKSRLYGLLTRTKPQELIPGEYSIPVPPRP
jgi:hypothetical protein